MNYRDKRRYDSDTPAENEWECQECGVINDLDWDHCEGCGCWREGKLPKSEE